MNKKIHSALNILLVIVVCLTLFTGCTQEKVDPWEIEESLDLVGKLVKVMHEWIGSYGWTVVVFTVFLKLLMLPLDIWQRYSTRKMAVKMQIMAPYVAEIDKRYGANSQKGAEEKQKLFKKHGYSMTSSCLPMIITMVVFFVMFGGLRSYSTYNSVQNFNALTETYYKTYAVEIVNNQPATTAEQKAYDVFVESYNKLGGALVDNKYAPEKFDKDEYNRVSKSLVAISFEVDNLKKTGNAGDLQLANEINAVIQKCKNIVITEVQNTYHDVVESWLWIENIAQPDTWETTMPKYGSGTNSFTSLVNMENYGSDDKGETLYNTIRDAVLQTSGHGKNGTWNGLMILPILSIALSFLSMFISQVMEKKNRQAQAQDAQQQTTNKMMMIMMPLMMAYFGFIYTGAFAIYMVANYLISIISTVALRKPVEIMVQKNIAKSPVDSGKASYMR